MKPWKLELSVCCVVFAHMKKTYLACCMTAVSTHLCTAIVDKLTVGAGFHRTELPQVKAIAAFHPYTATGKLNAVIIPTTPTGFHISIKA